MSEATAQTLHDLIDVTPRLPAPRLAPDDASHSTPSEPDVRTQTAPSRWLSPVAHLAGGSASVLGLQLLIPAATSTMLVLIVGWCALVAMTGCHAVRAIPEPLTRGSIRVIRAGGIMGLGSWLAYPIIGAAAAPAVLIPLVASLTATGVVVSALLRRRGPATIMLVGDPDGIADFAHGLSATSNLKIAAACSWTQVSNLPGVPIHIGADGAIDFACTQGADVVLILPCVPAATRRRLQWQAAEAAMEVYANTGLRDVDDSRMTPVEGAGLNLVHVRPAVLRGPKRVLKDWADRSAATVGLLLLLPVLLVVCAVIRRDTPGPAIFRQTRVGRDGQRFTMYKFRTMCANATEQQGDLSAANECDEVMFKIRHDPRITSVGVWLRRYSIDELPQLINVVRGEMSLVGPRPALVCEVEEYDIDPRRRLRVKPGLTGLWQVSGRSDLTWEESVRLDLSYVDNWSLTQDLMILGRTFGAVIGHRGAY